MDDRVFAAASVGVVAVTVAVCALAAAFAMGYALGEARGRRLGLEDAGRAFDDAVVRAQQEARLASVTGTVTLPFSEEAPAPRKSPLSDEEKRRILATSPLPPLSGQPSPRDVLEQDLGD